MSFYRRLFRFGLSKIEFGRLNVYEDFPGGESYTLSGKKPGYEAEIRISDYDFYRHSVLYGEIGFGEAYVENTWNSPDLNIALRWFAQNARALPGFSGSSGTRWFMNLLGFTNIIRHLLRPNTQRISRRNIAEHYDIGNRLYEQMLGRTMAYSCGVFADPEESLDKAQERKFALICEKLQLNKHDHLLEVGSGWGGFAIYAARKFGCKITTVTISEQQYNYAKQKIAAANLGHLIDLQLRDYRLLEGKFDKIVSIEMAEAIGFRYLDTFFKACAHLLREDGLMLLQYITFPESRFEQYLRNTDFTQIYIFPGSCLLSNLEVMKSIHRTSDLLLTDLETIGQHYATTLRLWRHNVDKNREKIRSEYSETFLRKWIYYLCFCEAGFAERAISDVQVVFSRAGTQRYGDFREGRRAYADRI